MGRRFGHENLVRGIRTTKQQVQIAVFGNYALFVACMRRE
jgi:hypothetical protein